MKENLELYREKTRTMDAQQILTWSLGEFGPDIALSSSLSAEDQVLTDIILSIDNSTNIFTIDTGRLPEKTHELLETTQKHYGCTFEILRPDRDEVSRMVSVYGKDLFYESVEKRKLCCHVRKVVPLRKKLSYLKAWICGLRKEQSVTRSDLSRVEWDENHHIFKISPLADWDTAQVWDYIRAHNVPYNGLHDSGYRSIGCAPCTRPVKSGEDIRAGRWWWESPEHKECGLHSPRKGPADGSSQQS